MTDAGDKSNLDEARTSGVRLQRFLAATGLGSRRHCEEHIVAGRISIDGKVVRDLGTRVDPRRQEVRVDGELVRREPTRYFLLNKPRGYLCTNSDPAGRPRAIDLVPGDKLRLFTVGRLDEGSEGLILLTNDGELAHRLAHPRFEVRRTYAVQVAGRPTPETFETLKRGIFFHEGRFRIDWVRRVGTKGKSTFLEVGLAHGQNREIRRLFARVGHKVMRLRRVAFGPLKLGRLAEGRFRPLQAAELKALRDLASRPRPPRPAAVQTSTPESTESSSRTGTRNKSTAIPAGGRRPVGRRERPVHQPLARQGRRPRTSDRHSQSSGRRRPRQHG